MASPLDLDASIDAVLRGDDAAWSALAGELHRMTLEVCRRRRFAAGSPTMVDVHREVALRTLERLHDREHAVLRQWVATRDRYPQSRFSAWLGALIANLFIDHQRGSDQFMRRRAGAERRLVAVPTDELDPEHAAEPITPLDSLEVARIARAICEPSFPAPQRLALAMWLRGHDADEIAGELGLAGGAAESRRLLNAARERLRRRVHNPATEEA